MFSDKVRIGFSNLNVFGLLNLNIRKSYNLV